MVTGWSNPATPTKASAADKLRLALSALPAGAHVPPVRSAPSACGFRAMLVSERPQDVFRFQTSFSKSFNARLRGDHEGLCPAPVSSNPGSLWRPTVQSRISPSSPLSLCNSSSEILTSIHKIRAGCQGQFGLSPGWLDLAESMSRAFVQALHQPLRRFYGCGFLYSVIPAWNRLFTREQTGMNRLLSNIGSRASSMNRPERR